MPSHTHNNIGLAIIIILDRPAPELQPRIWIVIQIITTHSKWNSTSSSTRRLSLSHTQKNMNIVGSHIHITQLPLLLATDAQNIKKCFDNLDERKNAVDKYINEIYTTNTKCDAVCQETDIQSSHGVSIK